VRPDLLRSWVSDAAGMADVQFEWHEFAKVWQTPEAGEAFFAEQLAAPLEQRAMGFEALGVPPARARQMAAGVDATMVTSILALYRSATTVSSEWGPPVDGLRIPGLVIVPENDPFLVGETAVRTAQRCHAQLVRFDGVGHWWPVEAPARGAEVLARFWSSLQ